MAAIFDSYRLAAAWDEMFAAPGQPRPAYHSLFATLQPLSGTDLRFRADQLARVFTDRGVTFAYAGEERPFPLDLIPRIIDAAEWDVVTRAVRQRVTALERFLSDVYGRGAVLDHAACLGRAPLARLMGVELAEGRDLVCSGNRVRMRTAQGERRVHVVYRRVDDEFLDPLHFRPDSVIGCPGIVNAARAGTVTLANAIGNGVADDKLLYTYVPDLIRYYLSEEPIIPNVETHRLDDPDVLGHVLDNLETLVLKPVDGSGGKGIVIGPAADESTLDSLRAAVAAEPRGCIAQRPVALSTPPTLIGNQVAPRHIDLRPFAINDGDDVWLLPGGLTRVALPEGALVVNSSQGGGSKDTWVLAAEPAATPPRPRTATKTVEVVPHDVAPRDTVAGPTGSQQ